MKPKPDPRPQVIAAGDRHLVVGERCSVCAHANPVPRGRCPDCLAPTDPAHYGTTGRVWSSTVVRIPVPGREPPYTLAYVDLEDGPRVLAHVRDRHEVVPIGTTVALVASVAGDLTVEVGA